MRVYAGAAVAHGYLWAGCDCSSLAFAASISVVHARTAHTLKAEPFEVPLQSV